MTWTTPVAVLASCSSAIGPRAATHPTGVVVGAPLVASRPFAVAISANGVGYVGRQDVPFLQATMLPDTTFGDSVKVGIDPSDIAFNKTGTTAYVTNQFSSTIEIVSTAAGVSTGTISVPGAPFRILVAPTATEVFVSSNNDSVYAIALSSHSVARRWGFNAPVNGMTLTANGSMLYVSSIGGTVYRFNADGSGSVDSVHAGGVPQDVALSPNRHELYVANEAGSLEVRDPTTLALVDTVAGAAGAFGLKPTPDGAQLYVTFPGAGLIRIIDVGSRTVGLTFSVGGTPRRVAFDRTGTTALVPNEAGFVSVIR